MKSQRRLIGLLRLIQANASHELRSFLMAIKTNADVAFKYPEGMRDTDAEKFTAIASASNQMTSLSELGKGSCFSLCF